MTTQEFWQGKKVLVTGHTGFKGSWLCLWLNKLGADVSGISLEPETVPNLFEDADIQGIVNSHFCDIRDRDALEKLIKQISPDIVFHLAAQALVRKSYSIPVETFDTNFTGTLNLLDALRKSVGVKVALMITTDKVYSDNFGAHAYSENSALGGHDPYSASKAACEIVIDCYRKSYLSSTGPVIASVRAGNVIGGGDWSEDRLIPDAIRAWDSGSQLEIRMPNAVRPWQHVLDPLYGYLKLAEAMWSDSKFADSWNVGPQLENVVTVREVIERAHSFYGSGETVYGESPPGLHEADCLRLNASKIENELGIKAILPVHEAVGLTIEWYKKYRDGMNARGLCIADINSYQSML